MTTDAPSAGGGSGAGLSSLKVIMVTQVYRGGYWPYRKPITCVAHEWSQGIQLKVAGAEAWEYSRDTGLLLEGVRLTNDSEVSGRGLIVKEIPAGYGGRTSTEGRDGVMRSSGSRSAGLRPSSGGAGGRGLGGGRGGQGGAWVCCRAAREARFYVPLRG